MVVWLLCSLVVCCVVCVVCVLVFLFFFFKQKTAYEMRISDWSSDVCSSDLVERRGDRVPGERFVEGQAERPDVVVVAIDVVVVMLVAMLVVSMPVVTMAVVAVAMIVLVRAVVDVALGVAVGLLLQPALHVGRLGQIGRAHV